MVKIRNPLFSLGAHGSVGTVLTYSKRKSGNQVRLQRGQKDVITDERTTMREYYAEALEKWHTLTDSEKQEWTEFNRV